MLGKRTGASATGPLPAVLFVTVGALTGLLLNAVLSPGVMGDVKIAPAIGIGLLADALFLDLRERKHAASGTALSADGRMPSLPRVRSAVIYLLASLAAVACLSVVLPPGATPLPLVGGTATAWVFTRSLVGPLRPSQSG
jgi:hypothetical protein